MKLPENIRLYRKQKGFSQEDIAKLLGYKSFTTIQKWETGLAEPPIGKLYELANILNVDILDLLDNDKDDSQSGYYTDPEVAAYAEELRSNPNMRILFSAAKNISKEDMEKAVEFITFLKSKEQSDNDLE